MRWPILWFAIGSPAIELPHLRLERRIQLRRRGQCPASLDAVHRQPPAHDEAPAVVLGGSNQIVQRLLIVSDEGKKWEHGGTHQDPSFGQTFHGEQAPPNRRTLGLEGPFDGSVQRADAVDDTDPALLVDVLQEVQVAGEQRRTFHDEKRKALLTDHLQHLPRKAISTLRRLPIPDGDHLSAQARHLLAQQVHCVDLDSNDLVEERGIPPADVPPPP